MTSRMPRKKDIDRLLTYLPRLYAPGFRPILRWGGGPTDSPNLCTMPWPEYDEVVEEFFKEASKPCWCDYGYRPEEAGLMLGDSSAVARASLSEVKTMLTFCVRGERFCDGHWGAMIEEGHIRQLLLRLRTIRDSLA